MNNLMRWQMIILCTLLLVSPLILYFALEIDRLKKERKE